MNMDELNQAMGDNNVVFLPADENNRELTCDVIKGLTDEGNTVVYISVSKPAMTRKKELKERGVSDDNVFFIDGSKSDDKIRRKNIVYVNPANLTDLSISLTHAVESLSENGPVVVVLDAIESLGLYNDTRSYQQFIHVLCSKMRKHEVPVLLIGTRDSIDQEMRSLITQFSDSTFDSGG